MQEALRTALEHNHWPIHARCVQLQGELCMDEGDDAQAQVHLQSALELMCTMGDRYGQLAVLVSMMAAVQQRHTRVPHECECRAVSLRAQCDQLARELHCEKALGQLLTHGHTCDHRDQPTSITSQAPHHQRRHSDPIYVNLQ